MATLTRDQFDSQQYLANNPDVAQSGMDAYDHYVNYGQAEGRSAYQLPVPITTYTANQVQTPTLPQGTELTPVLQQVQQNELMQGPQNLNPTQYNTAPVQQVQPQNVTAQTGTSTTVNPNDALSHITPGSGQVTATTTTAVPQMQAEQGTVSKNATVQGQLEGLMSQFDGGQVPAWAKGAMNKAEETMAARGLGSSSLAGSAIAAAIQQSALPIAAQDAATYFQMDMTNLSNRQQATLENTRMQQQNMLTDVSIQNATAQFNAANEMQKEQFVSQMVSQIQQQNAARTDAMTQFNVGQQNQTALTNASNQLQADTYNSQAEQARQQFNSSLANQRDQFNNQMQFAIEQSNVLWRRQVNTQNNASINAANQANVQNKFNMSQVAQNNLWQQFRDESAWSFTAAQNAMDRDYNASMAANNRNYVSKMQNQASQQQLMQSIGSFAFNLLS